MQTGRLLPCPEGIKFVGSDDDHGVFPVHGDPLRLPGRGPAHEFTEFGLGLGQLPAGSWRWTPSVRRDEISSRYLSPYD